MDCLGDRCSKNGHNGKDHLLTKHLWRLCDDYRIYFDQPSFSYYRCIVYGCIACPVCGEVVNPDLRNIHLESHPSCQICGEGVVKG